MELQLTGKTALVTGGNSGIGKAIVQAFAKAGANVAFTFNSQEPEATELANDLRKGGTEAIAVKADVSQEQDVLNLFKQVLDTYGKLDIVVCSAGLQKDNAFTDMTLEEWKKVIDVNLSGYFMCSREAARYFKKHPNPDGNAASGNIIFISSVHDVIPWAGHVNYASSKGGIAMLMKSVALELAPDKIRVNSISPGAIKTRINQDVWGDPAKAANLIKLIPYKRIGEPEDVASVALFLASPVSDYVTGSTIYVDGGMTLYPGFVDNG